MTAGEWLGMTARERFAVVALGLGRPWEGRRLPPPDDFEPIWAHRYTDPGAR